MTHPSFEEFKASIAPFLINVKSIAMEQLKLFKIIHGSIEITDETVSDYELFARILRHQINNNVERNLKKITPTLEVQLLWNVHALNPKEYFNDNHKAFGNVMSVHITKNDAFVSKSEMKENINSDRFKDIKSSMNSHSFVQKLDLKQAVVRQMKFIRKMNAIQNLEDITPEKINGAAERYCKFLYLMQLEGHTGDRRMSVPALDVDLIWHSHLLDAAKYNQMCTYMFSGVSIIDHDDSICFKKIMGQYREETRRRWSEAFGNEDYFKGRVFGKNIIFTRDGRVFHNTKRQYRSYANMFSPKHTSPKSENGQLSSNNENKISLADTITELINYKQHTHTRYNALEQQLNVEIEYKNKLHEQLGEYRRRMNELKQERGDLQNKLNISPKIQ